MKKFLALLLLLSVLVMPVRALDIPEGAIVKTANNPDVYIVKYQAGKSYKRLVLNPQVFQSYGHLKWENLLTIDPAAMDSFVTSDLVRVDGSTQIYRLTPDGDTGSKVLLESLDGLDASSVYTINSVDFGNYATSLPAGLSGPYRVARVIDGDTLSVSIDGTDTTVRLIGIDTPEVVSSVAAAECYGAEASAAAKNKLGGQTVRLEIDAASGNQDKYGRLLRYAYLPDGTLFNRWMIEQGNAEEYTYDRIAYKYQKNFQSAELAAKTNKRGLWGVEVCALQADIPNTAYVCAINTYNCSDFKSQSQAQAAYAHCLQEVGSDIHQLDSDRDGTVCESLP